MKALRSIILGLALLPALLRAQDYEFRIIWCQDVGAPLRAAQQSAYYTASYPEEKELLLGSIDDALPRVSSKHTPYFGYTLAYARQGVAVYPRVDDQVRFLRRQITRALEDLAFLDREIVRTWGMSCWDCEGDHGRYVLGVLARGQQDALAAKTDAEERMILDLTAGQGIVFLDSSDHRRQYACSRSRLDQAIKANFIVLKRKLIQSAMQELQYSRGCH